MTTAALTSRHCTPCKKGDPALTPQQAGDMMGALHADWTLNTDSTAMTRECRFGNYYETIAFVNALAWIAHREDHHPDLEVGYNRCVIHFSTHSIGGLSHNDFICAAKIDALLHSADQ
jgi:4a-hydroxytetrahydrobiopterin dehydratase